jgi:FecR protein
MATHFHLVWLLSSAVILFVSNLEAAALRDAHLSQVVHDVRVASSGSAGIPATTDTVLHDGSIETGADSRAELSFRDQTVVRFGDNTVLGFESVSRTLDLSSGAVLTQVPSGVGRTTLRVRNITATVTGTTLAVEFLPKAYTKFISLDGTSRVCLKKSTWSTECVLLRAGQMMIASPDPKALPEAVDVDLSHLVETCQFITEFPKLPGYERLAKAAAVQRERKSHGTFADTNLVIFGRGTVVSQRNPDKNATPGNSAGAKSATPAPSPKHNRPSPP